MAIDQYATVRPYFGATTPAGLTVDDASRVQAYETYEKFYWDVADAFKITPRSEDAAPIYLPTARKLIEATNRFLAVDWDFIVNPAVGVDGDRAAIQTLLRNIWKRELMYSKFTNQKRMGLVRGDTLWHVTANPDKADGERISIHELHPGNYFPIFDEENPDKIIGCHIVDTVPNPNDRTKSVTRRQTYRKTENNTITSELALYELNKWDDRVEADDATLMTVLRPAEELPGIHTLPVYHIKNQRGDGFWGSSELRGIETVAAAVNQGASDQDLAIAMQGLGVYWTDAGPPTDAQGNPSAFIMGPADVVEVPAGSQFGRVTGIGAGLPGIEHMNFIMGQAQEAIGVPDIAIGRVNVSVAESGISLYLQMAPILAKNAEKEQEMLGVYDHLLYDLVHQWLPAYEGLGDLDVEVASVVGDPLPQNREARIAELLTLVTSVPPMITIEMAQAELSKLGYTFPDNAATQVLQDALAVSTARGMADPYANRYAQELEGEGQTA